MKKLILIAAFLLLGIAANAQSSTPQIDTTDATIKYLLNRIESLEHQVNFERDKNDLNSLNQNLTNLWDEIRTTIMPKYIVEKNVELAEEQNRLLTKKIAASAVRYKYSDEEMNVLDSCYELINARIEMFREWLKSN